MKKPMFTCLLDQEGMSATDLLNTEANLPPGSGFSPDQGKTGRIAGGAASVTPENGFSLSPAPSPEGVVLRRPSAGQSGRSSSCTEYSVAPAPTFIRPRDLCLVRLRLLDLFKSFFDGKPEAERLGRWRGIFAALAGARISPAFDREAEGLARLLWQKNLNDLQREFHEAAASPNRQGEPAGTGFKNTRLAGAEIRLFMREAGLIRIPGSPLAEEGPLVPLDIMAALVAEERQGGGWRGVPLQAKFLGDILVPLADRLTATLERAGSTGFSCRCSRLLRAYLALELALAGIGDAATPGRRGHALPPFAALFAATAQLTGAALARKTIGRAHSVAGEAVRHPVFPARSRVEAAIRA